MFLHHFVKITNSLSVHSRTLERFKLLLDSRTRKLSFTVQQNFKKVQVISRLRIIKYSFLQSKFFSFIFNLKNSHCLKNKAIVWAFLQRLQVKPGEVIKTISAQSSSNKCKN